MGFDFPGLLKSVRQAGLGEVGFELSQSLEKMKIVREIDSRTYLLQNILRRKRREVTKTSCTQFNKVTSIQSGIVSLRKTFKFKMY